MKRGGRPRFGSERSAGLRARRMILDNDPLARKNSRAALQYSDIFGRGLSSLVAGRDSLKRTPMTSELMKKWRRPVASRPSARTGSALTLYEDGCVSVLGCTRTLKT